MGKGFATSSRIVNFFGRKYEVKVTRFFRLSLDCLTESRSFGYGLKDFISLHNLVVKVV